MALNISMSIPNFCPMYLIYTTAWVVSQIDMSRTDVISQPPTLFS